MCRKYSRNQQPCKRNGCSRSDQTSGRNKMWCKTNILPWPVIQSFKTGSWRIIFCEFHNYRKKRLLVLPLSGKTCSLLWGYLLFYVLILQDFDLYSVFRLLVTIVTFLIVFRSLVLMHYLSFICFMDICLYYFMVFLLYIIITYFYVFALL